MTSYSLFNHGVAVGTQTSSVPFLAGIAFEVEQGGTWLTDYWFYAGGATAAQTFTLWCVTGGPSSTLNTTTGGVVVPGSTVTSGTLTANSWNKVTLPSPVPLAIGTTYIAATGYTISGAFANEHNDFGTGGPYVSGITSGPLFAYSDTAGGGGTAGTGNPFGMAQGTFATGVGTDPTAHMPSAGSSSSSFGMDVAVSDVDPTGKYTGPYRIWPNNVAINAPSALDQPEQYVIGTVIALSQKCSVGKTWFYSPPGAVGLPTKCDLWRVSDQANMATMTPSWSGAAASGWVSASWPAGTQLPAGTYVASVYNGNATGTGNGWSAKDASSNYWDTGKGKNGITWGPLTALSLAASPTTFTQFPGGGTGHGQSVFENTTTGPDQFPDKYVTGLAQVYWVDLEVTPVGIPGTGLAVKGRPAPKGRSSGSPPPLVRPAPKPPASGATVRGRPARKGLAAGSPPPLVHPQEAPAPWGATVRGRPGRRGSARGSFPIPVIGPPHPAATGMLVAGRKGRKGRAAGSPLPQPPPPLPYVPILVSLGTARWLWSLGRSRNEEGSSLISLSQSALSTQLVQVQVEALTETGTAYDPTGNTVKVAFVPEAFPPGRPGADDWVTASWATDSAGNHWATALVGPDNGGTVLAYGSYVIWLTVVANPPVPVLPGPLLSIF